MASGSFWRRPSVFLALGLCMIGGVVTLLGRLAMGPAVEQKRLTIGNESGTKAYPAFSPDGKRLVYSMRDTSSAGAYHLFVRELPNGPAQTLTGGEGSDIGPAWSRDGKSIAFVRMEEKAGMGDRRVEASCMVMPAGGGEARKVTDCLMEAGEPQPEISWTRDSQGLVVVKGGEKQAAAIFQVSLAGAAKKLTNPEGQTSDSMPAVAPDGETMAFVRSSGGEGADIYLCDISGANPRRLTFDDRGIRGLAWTPDSREIIYSADRMKGSRLWRLPVYGGTPREVQIAGGGQAQYPAVSLAGGRLAFRDSNYVSAIWRATVQEDASDGSPLIRSAHGESYPSYSPDGTKIADVSGQTGTDEIWVSDAAGGNRLQLTHLNGPELRKPRWSPDGKTILFESNGDRGQELYTVPSAGGNPKRVQLGASSGSWSHDGKSIYFESHNKIWKASADGGNPQEVTNQFASEPVESADGRYVYYLNRRWLWRVPVGGGKDEQVVTPERGPIWSVLQPAKNGQVYYLQLVPMTRGMELMLYEDGANKALMSLRGVEFQRQRTFFSVSPDGRYVLYPRVDQSETELVLVENFH